jgi:CRP-like cAMP-binding protein
MGIDNILERFATSRERRLWEQCLAQNLHSYDRGAEFVRAGSEPRALHVVRAGWAQLYKPFRDGRRQIVGLVLPGEICDLDLLTVARSHFAVAAVRQVTVASLDYDMVAALFDECPRIASALGWSELLAAKRRSEWMASLGQRSAAGRIAHLMCELYTRQLSSASSPAGSCDFPLTQTQIADATGLTQVHVNRTLQALRRTTGAELRGRRLHVPDFSALADIASFTADYLHLDETAPIAARAMRMTTSGAATTRLEPLVATGFAVPLPLNSQERAYS